MNATYVTCTCRSSPRAARRASCTCIQMESATWPPALMDTKHRPAPSGHALLPRCRSLSAGRLLAVCDPVEDVELGVVAGRTGSAHPRRLSAHADRFVSLSIPVDGESLLEVAKVGNEGMVGAPLILKVTRSELRAAVQGAGPAWGSQRPDVHTRVGRERGPARRAASVPAGEDGPVRAGRRLHPLPSHRRAPRALAPDDAGSRAPQRVSRDPRGAGAHARCAPGRGHPRRQCAAEAQADPLPPRRSHDPEPRGDGGRLLRRAIRRTCACTRTCWQTRRARLPPGQWRHARRGAASRRTPSAAQRGRVSAPEPDSRRSSCPPRRRPQAKAARSSSRSRRPRC